MTNPFENEDAEFYVLVNDELQYSLWPAFADVPGGWSVDFGPEPRETCVAYVDRTWRDLRPKSVRRT